MGTGSNGNGYTNGLANGHAAPPDPGSAGNADEDEDDDGPENVEDLLGIALPQHEAGPAPAEVAELAQACERFVERAVGVRPDYTLETLPLVDHWLSTARGQLAADVLRVLVQAGGAYFGEVVRRRHPCWWALGGGIPDEWEIQFENTFLSLRPCDVIQEALRPRDPDEAPEEAVGEISLLEIDEDDRPAVVARLAELPEVSEEEYRSLATLVEVIDICVEAARARRIAAEEPEPTLEPEDYER